MVLTWHVRYLECVARYRRAATGLTGCNAATRSVVAPRSSLAFQLSGYSFNTTCAYDHTTLNTPVLVRSPKLSSIGPV